MNNSGKKKLDHLDETIIRNTLCVSFKFMTSNGFGILLILLEGLKRDIVPT